jgi:hypothetical protein
MKAGLLALFVCVPSLAVAAGADIPAGEYTSTHEVQINNGGTWEPAEVTDALRISQVDAGSQFELELWFTNGHSCTMSGVATAGQSGGLVYRESVEVYNPETDRMEPASCELEIRREGDVIRVIDRDNVCRRQYCGARGFIDHSFPLAR